MKRLLGNSKKMFQEVELHTINGDNNRSKYEQANIAFVIAKRLIADLPITPTNDAIYAIVDDIQVGLYDDLGTLENCDANWDQWLARTKELFYASGRLAFANTDFNKPIIKVRR